MARGTESDGIALERVNWLSLSPLDVGEFRELTAEDDLLGQMLGDSYGSSPANVNNRSRS